MKILIAEDDGTSRLLLAHTLRAGGHEVIAESDGLRALEAYQQQQPAVVITDWLMPGLDGLELVQQIRALRSPRYPWLIMLTALEFKSNYAATMKAGVDDYLTKPLDRDLLLVRIEVARRVVELNQEVSLLKQVLPLCMCCHAVRDTSAQWTELDQYFRRQTGIDFSHGFCPDCYFQKSVLPELELHERSGVALNAELLSDVVDHLGVAGDRLVARLETGTRAGPGGDEEQLKLIGRLASALGDGPLRALAEGGPGPAVASGLRAQLQRVKATFCAPRQQLQTG